MSFSIQKQSSKKLVALDVDVLLLDVDVDVNADDLCSWMPLKNTAENRCVKHPLLS